MQAPIGACITISCLRLCATLYPCEVNKQHSANVKPHTGMFFIWS